MTVLSHPNVSILSCTTYQSWPTQTSLGDGHLDSKERACQPKIAAVVDTVRMADSNHMQQPLAELTLLHKKEQKITALTTVEQCA